MKADDTFSLEGIIRLGQLQWSTTVAVTGRLTKRFYFVTFTDRVILYCFIISVFIFYIKIGFSFKFTSGFGKRDENYIL